MGTETERKFLVRGDAWRAGASSMVLRQGYLCDAVERTVRVRTAGDRAFLTVKGPTEGLTRLEFEYEIPFADGVALLDRLAGKPLVEKIRHVVPQGDLRWEIDEFLGENQGLIVAEIELTHADQPIHRPDWLGDEVTGDPRYYNVNLVRHPFRRWRRLGDVHRPVSASGFPPEGT